jgi:hypothetical protein
MHYIYALTNTVTGRVYIGRTCNPIARFKRHLAALKFDSKRCNPNLYKDYLKHGADSFEPKVIESGLWTTREARDRETYWIDQQINPYNKQRGIPGADIYRVLAHKAIGHGVRETSRRTGINAMAVSRIFRGLIVAEIA